MLISLSQWDSIDRSGIHLHLGSESLQASSISFCLETKREKLLQGKVDIGTSAKFFVLIPKKSYTVSRERRCGARTRKGAPAPAPIVLGIHSADLARGLRVFCTNQLSLSVWTSCKPPAPFPDSAHPLEKVLTPYPTPTKRTKSVSPPLRNYLRFVMR